MKRGARVVIVRTPGDWRDLIGRRATVQDYMGNYTPPMVRLLIDGVFSPPSTGYFHYQARIDEVRPLNMIEAIGEIDADARSE